MGFEHAIAPPRIDPLAIPFIETEAFRRFGGVIDPDVDALEDLYLKAIIREQGFDGLPHVVSRRALDRYVSAGEPELFRGLSDPAFAREFRFGAFFVGRGVYGGGANAAAGPSALTTAREYAAGGVILRLTLKRGARVTDFYELEEEAEKRRRTAIDELREAEAREVRTARARGLVPAVASIRGRFDIAQAAVHAEYDDIGRLAAYRGYDAVHAVDVGFYAILNRTAVRVQREDMR